MTASFDAYARNLERGLKGQKEDLTLSVGEDMAKKVGSPLGLSIYAAYIWGYSPAMLYRYSNLDTRTKTDGYGSLFKTTMPVDWLFPDSAPAPNNTALYSIAWLDLDKTEYIYHVPEIGSENYYVTQIMDAYTNGVASIGPRTMPSYGSSQDFLVVGPDSKYYKQKGWEAEIEIDGDTKTLPIIRNDTPLAWLAHRQFVNALDQESIREGFRITAGSSRKGRQKGFQLATLEEYIDNGGEVAYKKPITESRPDEQAQKEFADLPQKVDEFLNQVGEAWSQNPLPRRRDFGKNPDYQTWQGNRNIDQEDAVEYSPDNYIVPSAVTARKQKELELLFKRIGLTKKGYKPKHEPGTVQYERMQKAYEQVGADMYGLTTGKALAGTQETNWWGLNNKPVGIYDNDFNGYLYRTYASILGGSANINNDAVYPGVLVDNQTDPAVADPAINGNLFTSTYAYSIDIPASDQFGNKSQVAPAQGNTAFSVYQQNNGFAYQPNMIQNGISNIFYTPRDASAKLIKRGNKDQLRIRKPWNYSLSNYTDKALVFRNDGAPSGVEQDQTFFLKNPVVKGKWLFFEISETYNPNFNLDGSVPGTPGVPIPGGGTTGEAFVFSQDDGGQRFRFGFINPVGSLGSSQMKKNNPSLARSLKENQDGSITLHLRAQGNGISHSNWLPTPEASSKEAAKFTVMERLYWPNSAETSESILPEDATYIPPGVNRLYLERVNTWSFLGNPEASPFQESSTPDPYSVDIVGAFLDLTYINKSAGSIEVDYITGMGAGTSLSFVIVDDITGAISGVSPGEAGYTDLVRTNLLTQAQVAQNGQGSIQLEPGFIYAPVVEISGKYQMPFDNAFGLDERTFALNGAHSFSFSEAEEQKVSPQFTGSFMVTDVSLM